MTLSNWHWEFGYLLEFLLTQFIRRLETSGAVTQAQFKFCSLFNHVTDIFHLDLLINNEYHKNKTKKNTGESSPSFSYKHRTRQIKGVLTDYTVVMVTCYIKTKIIKLVN